MISQVFCRPLGGFVAPTALAEMELSLYDSHCTEWFGALSLGPLLLFMTASLGKFYRLCLILVVCGLVKSKH